MATFKVSHDDVLLRILKICTIMCKSVTSLYLSKDLSDPIQSLHT